jgi:DNA-binding PadR family transcriptional regulator
MKAQTARRLGERQMRCLRALEESGDYPGRSAHSYKITDAGKEELR